MVPCKSTAKEVSLEWSQHRILSTNLKVRTTLHDSIIDCVGKKVKQTLPAFTFICKKQQID